MKFTNHRGSVLGKSLLQISKWRRGKGREGRRKRGRNEGGREVERERGREAEGGSRRMGRKYTEL